MHRIAGGFAIFFVLTMPTLAEITVKTYMSGKNCLATPFNSKIRISGEDYWAQSSNRTLKGKVQFSSSGYTVHWSEETIKLQADRVNKEFKPVSVFLIDVVKRTISSDGFVNTITCE